jgi:hypothetical protein
VLAMFPCIARMRKTWPMLSTPSCWDKIVLEDLSRGIYGDEFQGWNPLQMLKWLQGLLPSRGAVVINRSVHPNFLNFLIRVKQPYIHTHSLTHSLKWEGEFTVTHSLTHSPTFIYMCKWVYLLITNKRKWKLANMQLAHVMKVTWFNIMLFLIQLFNAFDYLNTLLI